MILQNLPCNSIFQYKELLGKQEKQNLYVKNNIHEDFRLQEVVNDSYCDVLVIYSTFK